MTKGRGQSAGLQADDQNGIRRQVGAIVIGGNNYQIFFRIKSLQVGKNGVVFLETGVSSAVNTQRHKASLFQKGKSGRNRWNCGGCMGGNPVVSSGKVAETLKQSLIPIIIADSRISSNY